MGPGPPENRPRLGNRLRQQLVDEETREAVAPEHKGRGYEIGKGHYLLIEDAELEQNPIIAGGGIFPIEKFTYVNAIERDQIKKSVRYIDKAGTEDGGAYTAMALMHLMKDGTFVIEDMKRGQWSALEREKTLLRTVEKDAADLELNYSVFVEQEPGSGGKESAENSVRMLRGHRDQDREHPYDRDRPFINV